jgi:outer membrane receptor for ferrienterochelin and colicins
VAAAHTQGIEAAARLRVGAGVTLQIGYTLTDTEDEESGLALEGRALHRGTFEATYRGTAWGIDASLRGAVVGERPFYVDRDGDGMSETETSDPYASIDARVAKHFGSTFTLFAGVDNLLDAGDSAFVPIPPRTIYGGAVARY